MARKTIVITGASDGIGAAAARELAAAGHEVVVVGRDPDRTRAVAEEIDAEHHVADEPFLDGVLAWLAPIAARPPAALAAAKRAILDGLALPLEQGLAREAELVGPLLVGEQAQTLMAGAIAAYATTPADQDVEL